MKKNNLLILWLLIFAGASPAQDAAEQPMHAVPGWYMGIPVLLAARQPAVDVDRKSLPTMPVYITAPVSESAGSAPAKTIPRPGGKVFLPQHQDTLPCMASEEEPLLAVGYFVEIGPEGDDSNVRIQPQPENAWPRRPLASEILIGTEWVKLNSHVAIEVGVKMGLLQLEFFDVGGLMWGVPYDPDVKLTAAECALAEDVELPPIDWVNDEDYVPGQN